MSDEAATGAAPQNAGGGKGLTIASWVTRLIVVAIFAMGAIPKFTTSAEELPLDDNLPMGMTSVYIIGAFEILAIILLLVPKTAVYGAILASLIMLGAIVSHFTVVGMEGDVLKQMFVMAIVAFLAAGATVFLRRKDLPGQA